MGLGVCKQRALGLLGVTETFGSEMPKRAVRSFVGFEGGLVEALLGFVEVGNVPNASKILVRRSLFWFRAGFETMAASELEVAEAGRGRAGLETMPSSEF